MTSFLSAVLIILLTVLLFLTSRYLYSRYPIVVFSPVIFCSVIIVLVLLMFDITYETYMIGGQWIHNFLGSIVVALAYPLYKQRNIILKYIFPIISGVVTGILVSVYTGLLFSYFLDIADELIPSVATKSVTSPIAIQVTEELKGISSLSAVFVMIAGFSGVIFGPAVLKLFKIESALGKGIGFGSASHAIGTSKAFEYDELTGSISSASMILTAVIASFVIPILL